MSDSKHTMVDNIILQDNVSKMKQEIIEVNFELTADNYDTFDERLNYRGLSEEFVQENTLRGIRRTFQLYKDAYIFQGLEWYRDKENKKYRLNLSCLKSKPEHIVKLQWKWVSSAIATAIWSIILIYVGYFTDVSSLVNDLEPVHMISCGVLMGTITVISLLLFLHYREDKFVFRGFQSDLVLIELDNNKPDTHNFERLLQSIRKAIEKSTHYTDTQEQLVIELKELRRLRDEGVISTQDYETSRQLIFSHREYKA